MNPCHCGYLGSAGQECSKAPICGENYQRKISGPFLDRIDIHINVNTSAKDIIAAKNNDSVNESSHAVQERVIKVRSFQQERYKNLPIKTNSELNGTILDKFCTTTEQAKKFLESYIEKYNYSIRGYVKILRTARTIADMEFYENINHLHMQEAISYRNVEIKKPKI